MSSFLNSFRNNSHFSDLEDLTQAVTGFTLEHIFPTLEWAFSLITGLEDISPMTVDVNGIPTPVTQSCLPIYQVARNGPTADGLHHLHEFYPEVAVAEGLDAEVAQAMFNPA